MAQGQGVNARMRGLIAGVVLLTAVAAALVWNLNLRYQREIREQVLLQAEKRTLQLSDVLAQQMNGYFSSVDLALNNLRREWLNGDHAEFGAVVRETLAQLPEDFVSHAVVADAKGQVLFNSLGPGPAVSIADRDYFRAHLLSDDHLAMGVPVLSRLNGRWVIAVSRPILKDRRFEGTVHLTLSTEALAQSLAGVELFADDVVVLVHADGHVLARSVENAEAMGQKAPPDRPFLMVKEQISGVYHMAGTVDKVPRTYGWRRLQSTGAVVIFGISDRSVFEPLTRALQRSQRFAAALSLLLFIGGVLAALLLLRVARSQAEASESEARLKEAQRLARVGSWEWDFVRNECRCSDEIYRILGMEPGTGSLSMDSFLARLHPEDRERLQLRLQDPKASDAHRDLIFRIVMPDGSAKHVREVWVNEFDGDRLVRTRGTLQDVQEVHSAQMALMQLNEKLEQRVEERTRELGAVNQELEAFAYSVSHDLRTPLRSIHGFASLMEEELKGLQGEVPVFLARIQEASKRMGVLITDLLSMAHHGRAPVHIACVNLTELALAVADELKRQDPGRQVQWDIEEGLTARADPMLMRVVLQNYLGNAWKYSGRTEGARIRFSRTQWADGMQEFCVQDNGAGFDMAYAQQLFQPFKRLHTNHEFEGSGVGLATVQRVVQRHGGAVRGEGVQGQGAAFYFTLPDQPLVQEVALA